MSSGAGGLDNVEAAMANYPASVEKNATYVGGEKDLVSDTSSELAVGPNGQPQPTADEYATLRKVRGKINWIIYTIAFVELCERFAYYGTTTVFTNFIQHPLPEGSTTGAQTALDDQPGALGLGQQASTGLTLFNSFWAYLMPMVGGYIADAFWGRFKTIQWAIWIAMLGHVIIIVSALPPVIRNPNGAVGCFVVGLIFFGVGVGWFKCNISPLIAENYEASHPKPYVDVLPTGEKVIVDPNLTISIIYVRYYWMINVGALAGQISMVYAEKYVGFWLSFTLPTILFFFCPFVMLWCKNKYVHRPPTGSVLSKSLSLLGHVAAAQKTANPVTLLSRLSKEEAWEGAKPSNNTIKPKWMTYDDQWVDEVRRGFKACTVFAFYPIFWLPYSQMTNNITSQAATMKLNGIPNDIVHNLNPLTLLIAIPIFDKFIYPAMDKAKIRFTPIRKITAGFFFGAAAMAVTAIIQHFIYSQSECGKFASSCDNPPNLSVWIQTPAYILIAFSEIFASITGLEYAFTKAPKNMRGLITGMFWFAQAFSSALGQAFVPLAKDPLIVWLYTTVCILAVLGGLGFWFTFKNLDAQEEELNALPESSYKGRGNLDVETKAVD